MLAMGPSNVVSLMRTPSPASQLLQFTRVNPIHPCEPDSVGAGLLAMGPSNVATLLRTSSLASQLLQFNRVNPIHPCEPVSVGAGLLAMGPSNVASLLRTPSLASQLLRFNRVNPIHPCEPDSVGAGLLAKAGVQSPPGAGGALFFLGVEDRGVFARVDTIEVVVADMMQAPADRVVGGVNPGVAPEAVEVPFVQG